MATRYITQAAFEARFGSAELSGLTEAGHAFDAVENEAAGLVDGYLAARYALPLATVPGVVLSITADVLRYRLWDDRAPEEVRRRYEDALAQLRDIAAGRLALPPGSDGVAPGAGSLGMDGYSDPRVFTADTLRGF